MSAALKDSLGRPMHDLRISLTDMCNFRCPYCMPAEIYHDNYVFLRKEELLTFGEIVRITQILAQLGVRKVRLTGGEPLLRPWLPELIERIVAIPGVEDVALITNGLLLEKLAEKLKRAGLARLTVSLDSLDPERFAALSGRGHRVEQVLAGVDAAVRAGFTSLKFNMVVQRGINDDEVVSMAKYFRGTGHVIRYIEFMDVGNINDWKRSRVVPSREIVAAIDRAFPLEPVGAGYRGEVAKRYRYRDGQGEIGLISSITEPFCGDCTRVRLSADGKIYTCLFARKGNDVRELLRSGVGDEEITRRVEAIWTLRRDRYSEERFETRRAGSTDTDKKVEMFHIGG